MAWIDDFKNPPAENRIKPFWFWNGDMDKKEIDRQLKEMVDKGLGGAFICARQGLSIPYLSKEWFELVKYAGEKAAEYGIETWLYDEYPYPSGMSGGEVLRKARRSFGNTYSRTTELMDQFSKAFTMADRVYITDIYAAREKDTGTVDASNLVKRINNVTDNAVYIASFKDIVNRLIQDSSPGDLILTMGAGNVDQIGNMFLQEKKIRAVG